MSIVSCLTGAESTRTDAQPGVAQLFILTGQSNAGGRASWREAEQPLGPADAEVLYFYDTDTTGAYKGMHSSEGKFVALGPAANDRFGPEMGLSRRLRELGVERQIMVKFARGGTNLYSDWKPGAEEGKMLYAELLQQISRATKQLEEDGVAFQLAGLFWMQGESDSGASSGYGRNLTNLMASLRKDLESPELPIVIGRVAPNDKEGRERVRQAQVETAEADALAGWVDTDDLGRFDGTHFDAPSTLLLGQRMAEEWQRIRTNALVSP